MTTDNFCFYLQNRLIQTSQTGGQQYSDTSSFSIPWTKNGRFDIPPIEDLLIQDFEWLRTDEHSNLEPSSVTQDEDMPGNPY